MTPRGRKSIAGKLALAVAASVLTAALALGAFAFGGALRDYASDKRRLLAETAAAYAAAASSATAAGDAAGVRRAIRGIARSDQLVYARVESADGRSLAEIGGAVQLSRDAAFDLDATQGFDLVGLSRSGTVTLSRSVTEGGRPVGRIVLVSETADLRQRLAELALRTGLAAGLALLLGLAIALRMQRSITAPILDLARTVDRIRTDQDYSALPNARGADEVVKLVDGFNAMIGAISERDAAIAAHVRELEARVEARTHDLSLAKDAAEAATRAKSDFLAAMSHEIRTPMNGVLAMAEMLSSGARDPRQRRFADVIVQSGRSLLAILNDLLDLSKIEAGKLTLEDGEIDLVDAAEQAAALFLERARAKGLELCVFVSPDLPRRVAGDPVRVGQILSNLIGNAVKFTEKGGVLVRVERAPDGQMRFGVTDTGIGIAEDKLASVFAPFTQADQSTTRRFGGTGLGLTICRRLAEAMGGEVRALSRLGHGSTFVFTAPLAPLEPAAPWKARPRGACAIALTGPIAMKAVGLYLDAAGWTIDPDAALRLDAERLAPDGLILRDAVEAALYGETTAPARAAAAAEPWFAGARALVADDNAVNREVAVEALARFGVTAVTVEHGAAALEALGRDRFDVVFMDGSMPVMDGFTATAAWRAREAETGAARTPVVALTADVMGEAADAWTRSGADAVLLKPFTLPALAGVLGRWLVAGPRPTETEAAPEPETPPAPGDFAALDAMGDAGFVARVSSLYLDRAPPLAADLDAAAASGDLERIGRAAHALKSMSLSIGAMGVAEAATQVERRARIDRLPVAPEAIAAVHAALSSALAALSSRVGAPAPSLTRPPPVRPALDAASLGPLFDQLDLHYQPILDRAGVADLGAEALLRRKGLTHTSTWLAALLAEIDRGGLSFALDEWVLRRALRDASAWPSGFVSVNIAPAQVFDPAFERVVWSALEESGMPPERLTLEILEQSALDADAGASAHVRRLKDRGVSFALDDFGTGYASLTQLRRFPIDKVKIDQSFVGDLGKALDAGAIVHAVTSVGRAMGIKVLAEGVETPAQHAFLKAAGVHGLQGWLFAKAMAAEDVARRFAAAARRPA